MWLRLSHARERRYPGALNEAKSSADAKLSGSYDWQDLWVQVPFVSVTLTVFSQVQVDLCARPVEHDLHTLHGVSAV